MRDYIILFRRVWQQFGDADILVPGIVARAVINADLDTAVLGKLCFERHPERREKGFSPHLSLIRHSGVAPTPTVYLILNGSCSDTCAFALVPPHAITEAAAIPTMALLVVPMMLKFG